MAGTKWMLSVEGCVVTTLQTKHASFVAGLAGIMAFYYVFNFQYEEGAEKTLELLQRCSIQFLYLVMKDCT